MASFLKGLMGSLSGLTKSGGLMGGIDPALNGTPAGAARAPGTAGALPAPDEDIGDFHFGPGLTVNVGAHPSAGQEMASAEAAGRTTPKKTSFLDRWSERSDETGNSRIDALRQLGARLEDRADGGARAKDLTAAADARVAKGESAKKQALFAEQVKAMYPDDPKMQFLLLSGGEKGMAALANVEEARRKPAVEKIDDRFAFIDPFDKSVAFSDRRGATRSEETADARLEHDVVQDEREFTLDDWFKRQQTERQWAEHNARLKSGGYGTPGVGAGGRVLGPQLDPNDGW